MSTGNDANFEKLVESFKEKVENDENKNVDVQDEAKDSMGGKPKEIKGKDGDKEKVIALESEESSEENKDGVKEDDEPAEVEEQEVEDIDEEDELFELLINLPLEKIETLFDEKAELGPLPYAIARMILDKMDTEEKLELLDKLRAEESEPMENKKGGDKTRDIPEDTNEDVNSEGKPILEQGGEQVGPFEVTEEEFNTLAYTLEDFEETIPDPDLLDALDGQGNVTVIATDGRRFIGIDPQGYSYPRYKTPIVGSAEGVMIAAEEGEWRRKWVKGD